MCGTDDLVIIGLCCAVFIDISAVFYRGFMGGAVPVFYEFISDMKWKTHRSVLLSLFLKPYLELSLSVARQAATTCSINKTVLEHSVKWSLPWK